MSSGSSITWKMRSPDAVARCAWPIHMPSCRSGITSMRQVEVEAHEVAQRERAVRDHVAADEQDRRLREQRQEAEERDVEAPAAGSRFTLSTKTSSDLALELRLLGRFLRERLDDVDADDVLLGDGRDVGHLLLHVAEQRMRDVAVAVGDGDQHRRDRQRDERELPRDDEDDDADAERP